MKKIVATILAVMMVFAAFASPEGTDVVVEQRYLLDGTMGNEGFRMEDSGLMNARGGNHLSSAFSPVSASSNSKEWEQLISYGGSR